jgi:hypothetical protein
MVHFCTVTLFFLVEILVTAVCSSLHFCLDMPEIVISAAVSEGRVRVWYSDRD